MSSCSGDVPKRHTHTLIKTVRNVSGNIKREHGMKCALINRKEAK